LKVWLDGGLVDADRACISPFDRGFLLGDGVFETLRSHSGRPFRLRQHLERLEAGARALGLAVPPPGELELGARSLLEATGLADARIRITLTSGPGPPGLARGESTSTVLITASALRPWVAAATAALAPWAHDERRPLAGVKTTSRAESVVALAFARARGADEALFLNSRGNVCEATTANVFFVRDRRVETPPLSAGCLAGITRECVLGLCSELDLEGREADLPGEALRAADEIFLTSSTRGVQPLVALDGSAVGGGAAGALTRRLSDALGELVQRELAADRPL
jgi:branched-chain amino acid aminotransferase